MRHKYGRLPCLAIMITALLACGCQSLERNRGSAEVNVVSPELSDEPKVSVGGLVQSPQNLAIPSAGLTLISAVNIASADYAAVTAVLTDDEAQQIKDEEVSLSQLLFVVLRRRSSFGSEVHYLPFSLVQHSLAGDIKLMDHDVIQLVKLGELPAVSTGNKPATGEEFVVTGQVDQPGRYAINESLEGDRLKGVNRINYPGTDRDSSVTIAV